MRRWVGGPVLYVAGRDTRLDRTVRMTLACAGLSVAVYAGVAARWGLAASPSGTAVLWGVAVAGAGTALMWVVSPVALSGWPATLYALVTDMGLAVGLGVLADTHLMFAGCILFVLTSSFVTIHVPPIAQGMHLIFVAAFSCNTAVLMVVREHAPAPLVVIGASIWVWVLVGAPLAIRRIWVSTSAAAELARHDPLTGLLNRAGLTHAYRDLANTARRDRSAMSVIAVDIDRFKFVNDRYGHSVGDAVIIETAHHLAHYFGRAAAIARCGGEEFTVIITGDPARLNRQVAATATVTPGVHGPPVTLSIGAVTCDSLELQHDDLLRAAMARADAAMYTAKTRGGNHTYLI